MVWLRLITYSVNTNHYKLPVIQLCWHMYSWSGYWVFGRKY